MAATYYNTDSASTSASTYGYSDYTYGATTSASAYRTAKDWLYREPEDRYYVEYRIPDKIPAGKRELTLPDGAKLLIDDAGNYRIDDSDAKVVYKANRSREFSPHINASDMLAQFVEYARKVGVPREDVMQLPIELFVSWLVIEAAERDGDDIPADVPRIEQAPALVELRNPRCLSCGRFIPRLHHRHRFPFCSPDHVIRHVGKLA